MGFFGELFSSGLSLGVSVINIFVYCLVIFLSGIFCFVVTLAGSGEKNYSFYILNRILNLQIFFISSFFVV